jgi:hypothetical protein
MQAMPFSFSNKRSGRATQMPRARTELTGDSKHVGIRLTPTQYQEWKRLGGAMWLRKVLAQSIQNKRSADDK